MAEHREHFVVIIAALMVLMRCSTKAYAVSPHCLFSNIIKSTAENELQGMTLETCIVDGDEDRLNTTSCTKPHVDSPPKVVRLDCLCGKNHHLSDYLFDNDLDCAVFNVCSVDKKTRNWTCLNGGTLLTNRSCSCPPSFSGERCQFVMVTRKCSETSSRGGLVSCENAGDSKSPCLYSVNHNWFHCGPPIISSEVSEEWPECSEVPRTDTSDDGQWSTWSPWSVCSMAGNDMSSGPCMCHSRECLDGKCGGDKTEVSNCTEHGQWTDWTSWSKCSATRGRMGEQTRYRNCSNPAPKYGGRPCEGSSESTEVQTEKCSHDCPVSGSELQMTEFSSWANMTFDEGIPGRLKVRTKLVCQVPGGELEEMNAEEVAESCYLLKVSVEHCNKDQCTPLKGLRKLIEKSSHVEKYQSQRPAIKPYN